MAQIAEDLLLLLLDNASGHPALERDHCERVLAGAVLLDLAYACRIRPAVPGERVQPGRLLALTGGGALDPVVEPAFRLLQRSPLRPSTAVDKLRKNAQEHVAVHLERMGQHRWGLGHRLWKAILAQLIFQSVVFAIGGWTAVEVALAGMIGARFWVESFNYFQHYGLIRVDGGAITRRHVWNHFKPLSRVMGFEITNHADHHTNSFAAYHELKPDLEWIPMPSVFVCFFSALIPPLWHNLVIKPALRRWDNELASEEELVLAREQNRRAGWPDWFEDKKAA